MIHLHMPLGRPPSLKATLGRFSRLPVVEVENQERLRKGLFSCLRRAGWPFSEVLKDGTKGLSAVHEAGGLTVVQDPGGAEYPDMPTNAMERLPVTFCLKLADIGPTLELLVRRTARFETGLALAVRTLRDRAALLVRLGEQSWRNPETREFPRKERASLRRDIQSIDF